MKNTSIKIIPFEYSNMTSIMNSCLSSESQIDFNESFEIDVTVARKFPEKLARNHCLIPVGIVDDKVVVAMANPLDVTARDAVCARFNKEVRVVIAPKNEILKAIETIYDETSEQSLHSLIEDENRLEIDSRTECENKDAFTEKDAEKAPVVRYVDLLLKQAIQKRASDIHIEPQEGKTGVRFRIDGILEEAIAPTINMQLAVTARIKILAGMNIAERRLPQDGHFRATIGSNRVDVRVSMIPTKHGEKAVLRLLDPDANVFSLDQLGFETYELNLFENVLSRPHGIIIVTGPTGSGKSTTLYSALKYLNSPQRNIMTVEDPIEYTVSGINQIQVKEEIGLDFAASLRSILRQDPDVILIGEIRDKESAEIATKAALTGHIVLSTLHTNDAPSALSRLINIGIQPYLLASSLNLVIAQRLVRRICENCKVQVHLPSKVLKRLCLKEHEDILAYQGQGCDVCRGTGYSGRLPIFEFFPISSELRQKLASVTNEFEIRCHLRKMGYGGLLACGVRKIKEGLTTPEEVLAVAYEDEDFTLSSEDESHSESEIFEHAP